MTTVAAMTGTAQRYPFDYDELDKGSFIPPEKIESLLGVRRDHAQYALRVLRLCEQITEELAAREKRVTVVGDGGGIRILTDAEASAYNNRAADLAYSKMGRSLARLQAVDPTEFEDNTKRLHERRLLVVGHMLRGAQHGRKEALKLVAHERSTPALLPDAR